MPRSLGINVRHRRLMLGISQEALGLALGVHQTHIANIENGNKTPSLRLVQKFANFFKTSIDDMLAQPCSPENVPEGCGDIQPIFSTTTHPAATALEELA